MNHVKNTDILQGPENGNGRLKFWASFTLSLIVSGYSFLVIQPDFRGEYQTKLASLIIGTVFIGGLLLYRGLYQKARLPVTGFELPFLFSLLALIVSSLLSPNPRLGIPPFVLFVTCALIFLILYDGLDLYLDQTGLISGLLLFSGFVLFLAMGEILLNYYYWWSETGSLFPLPPTPYRVISIATHSNSLMVYLNTCAPFVIFGLFHSRKTRFRISYLVWITLFSFVVPFTSSRGGWISTLAWIFFILIIWVLKNELRDELLYRWNRKPGVQKGLVLMIFPVLAVLVSILWNYFGNHPSHGGLGANLFSSRSNIYTAALKTWLEKPVFGTGPGSFPFKYLEYVKSFPPGFWAMDAHSYPLQILAELGLVGLLALASFIYLGGLAFWQYKREKSLDSLDWWTAAAAMGVIGFSVNSLFVDSSDRLFLLFPFISASVILFKRVNLKTSYFDKIRFSSLLAPSVLIFIIQVWILWAYQPMAQALFKADQENWHEAAQLVSTTVERDPGMPFFQMHAGLAWSRVWIIENDISALNKAQTYFYNSYKIQPGNPIVLANLAVLEWHLHDETNAIKHMQSAVEMAPQEVSFLLNLAMFQENSGSKTLAATYYKKALNLTPELHTHPFFGQTILRSSVVSSWRKKNLDDHLVNKSKKDYFWQKAISAYEIRDLKSAKKWAAYSSWLQEPSLPLEVVNSNIHEVRGDVDADKQFLSYMVRRQDRMNIGTSFLDVYHYKGPNLGVVPSFIRILPDYGHINKLQQIKKEIDKSKNQYPNQCIDFLLEDIIRGGIDSKFISSKDCH